MEEEQLPKEEGHEENHYKTNRQRVSPVCREKPVRISYTYKKKKAIEDEEEGMFKLGEYYRRQIEW